MPKTVELLLEQRATIEAMLPGAGSPWIISSEPGVPWTPDRAGKTWVQIRALVPGLAGVRLHDARHFAATELLGAGLPAKDVAERLGHRDASVTLRVYAKASDVAARRASEILSGLLD
jgi:integrase